MQTEKCHETYCSVHFWRILILAFIPPSLGEESFPSLLPPRGEDGESSSPGGEVKVFTSLHQGKGMSFIAPSRGRMGSLCLFPPGGHVEVYHSPPPGERNTQKNGQNPKNYVRNVLNSLKSGRILVSRTLHPLPTRSNPRLAWRFAPGQSADWTFVGSVCRVRSTRIVVAPLFPKPRLRRGFGKSGAPPLRVSRPLRRCHLDFLGRLVSVVGGRRSVYSSPQGWRDESED